MEEILDLDKPQGKVFTDKSAGLALFFGGPLVGGFLFSHNFKNLGEPNKILNSWIIAFVVYVVLLAIIFSIPEDVKIPNVLFFLAYIGLYRVFYNKYQKDAVDAHINAGGDKQHWTISLLVGIVGLILNFVIIFALTYMIYGYSFF